MKYNAVTVTQLNKYLKDKLFENSEKIYENSAGGIIKYKK